ncbi:hypothetical protein EJ04DRAFT_566935 [Polyplosphaeria fusca]|uniref:Uncharacterized protein n=1 Tax=Polyplosphaeria fusca TaxID=682080 RepID=A0A9P4QUN5_9PLEO|nr:hypothetical protein EJ04DRAFT_566935 [Polyplosphaeria fusca]
MELNPVEILVRGMNVLQDPLAAVAIILFFSIAIYNRAAAQHESRSTKSTALMACASVAGIGIAATAVGVVPQSVRTSISTAFAVGGIAIVMTLWGGVFSNVMDMSWAQAAAR